MYVLLMLLERSFRIEISSATLIVIRREVIIPSAPTSASASASAWCKRFQNLSATGPNTKFCSSCFNCKYESVCVDKRVVEPLRLLGILRVCSHRGC
jgi:hypothetical protein